MDVNDSRNFMWLAAPRSFTRLNTYISLVPGAFILLEEEMDPIKNYCNKSQDYLIWSLSIF